MHWRRSTARGRRSARWTWPSTATTSACGRCCRRPGSEEHTSELQSLRQLVCRLLPEKKKTLQRPVRNRAVVESRGTALRAIRPPTSYALRVPRTTAQHDGSYAVHIEPLHTRQ